MPSPNILIFMADHHRADTVLPEHPAIMPNVKAMARSGVTFTNVFTPTAHCCPARATFHSGLYPSRHGVWNNVCNPQALSRGPQPGVRMWSEDLAVAGYRMEWVGKWHVSALTWPRDHGWTEHFVSAGPDARHGLSWDDYQRMASRPDDPSRDPGEILRPGYGKVQLYGNAPEGSDDHDERVVREVTAVLPELAACGRPWAMFVGVLAPHDPYVVPRRFLDLYDPETIELPPSYADTLEDKPRVYQRMRRQIFGQFDERETRECIRHFWAFSTYVDDMFGRVLRALDANGLADNTVVIFCSDHGDYTGDHGLFCKGIPCFRGAYQVPTVIRWPAGIRNPGRRVGEFITLADFAPTFLELAGVAGDREFSGRSFAPFLRDQRPRDWPDEVHTQMNGVELYFMQRSVMTSDHKYVFNGFDLDELYDLRADSHEMRNLSEDAAYQDVKRQLCQRMWRFACCEQDIVTSNYITVGLAPYGPAEAFRSP